MADLLAELNQREPVNLLAELRPPQQDQSLAQIETDIVADLMKGGVPEDAAKKEAFRLARERGKGDVIAGLPEAALTIATGVAASIPAGLAGIGAAIAPGGKTGAEAVQDVQSALTFQPRSEAGSQALQQIAQAGEFLNTPFAAAGDFVLDKTGSPALATLTQLAPELIPSAFAVRQALRGSKAGIRLLDDAGQPTKALEISLDKQGLLFENLEDAVRDSIPKEAPRSFLTATQKSEATAAAETALIQQIKAGGRDDALAGLRVADDQVVADVAANQALKQGFEKSFVQLVKTSTPDTKKAMDKILTMTQRIRGNQSLLKRLRPTDVIGDTVGKRIEFIRDQSLAARKELGFIARTELKGKPLDPAPIVSKLESALDDLDVTLTEGADGVPVPNFKGSVVSKNPASKRAIKDLIDLMSEGGAPDALRFHKMKRQLDDLIDFNKKAATGLSDSGRNVLKDARTSLNDSIREISPEYARVNDVMSSSIRAIDDFQKAAGTSIKIFGEGASKAIGTRMRALLSNQQNRVNLENSMSKITDTANKLGGNFKEDIPDLVAFADNLEDTFGVVARTSLKGQVAGARAAETLATQGTKAAAFQASKDVISEGVKKARGINELNQFRAMRELLRRQE